MKKFLLPILFLCVVFLSCESNSSLEVKDNTPNNEIKEIAVMNGLDSIAKITSTIDSLKNRGFLFHLDNYEIGKFKGIVISVQKVAVESSTISYINLRKDCGGEYYYSWEDAHIYNKELPSFYSAIRTIKNNLERKVDHEEIIAYSTNDDITVRAECKNGSNWKITFSVDINKTNSFVNISKEELDKLMELIKQAEAKLKEIETVL